MTSARPGDAAAPTGSMGQGGSTGRDSVIIGALTVAALGLLYAWRTGLGLWGALGTDSTLWGLTAVDLSQGLPALVPPLYPALIALLRAQDLSVVGAGLVLSMVSAAALPGCVYAAARAGGASLNAALAAGLITFCVPDLCGMGQQLQPDAMTALGLTGLGALLALGTPRALWWAAGLAGLLPLLREHGLPAAGLTVLVFALSPGPRLRRIVLLIGVAIGVCFLLGGGLNPLDASWSDRAGGALGVLLHPSVEAAPYARTLGRAGAAEYFELLNRQDRLGLALSHARRGLALAGDVWLALAAAALSALALSAPDRPRLARLLAPALSALPALFLWSQRRHAMVVLPLALACGAVAWSRTTHRKLLRGAFLAVLLSLAVTWGRSWPALASAQQSEAPRARSFAAVGEWLRDYAPDNSLLGGVFQDIGLYYPLPRHDPDGSAADWLTFWVTDRGQPADGWTAVWTGPAGMTIYRLQPALAPRPCADARPAPGAPTLVAGPAHAALIVGTSPCRGSKSSPEGAATR